jgi:hypothetical protein
VGRPRRESKLRRRSPRDELRLTLALVIGPNPGRDDDLSDAELREAWIEKRDRLLADSPPGSAPWGFWRFGAVPRRLRAQRPEFVPIGDDEPASSSEDRQLEERRAEWLAVNIAA